MVNHGKYDKYFCEANPEEFLYITSVKDFKPAELNHFDYRDHEEAPYFIEVGLNGGAVAIGRRQKGVTTAPPLPSFTDPRAYYSTVYRAAPVRPGPSHRLFSETRSFFSLDPDHPEDIGTTLHMWMGDGEEAELYVIDKPTTQLVPVATTGSLSYAVESHGKPGLMLIICDNPLEAIVPSLDMIPPGIKNANAPLREIKIPGFEKYGTDNWMPPKVKPTPQGKGKYGQYYSEIDVKGLPVYPAHKGKIARIMYYDGCCHPEAPKCIDCYLVYRSGVGFGLGDTKKLPVLPNGETDQVSSYEPLLPHKHPFYQTYTFSPTDKDNYPDLGGVVEFWMGEGEKAEKHVITKAMTVLVPKNTVHLPLYVREMRKPFSIITILDTPMWVGCYTDKLPIDFKL